MPTRTKDQNTLSIGTWNTICDVCGFKFKAVDLRKRWDGFWVCKEDWEPRHPMDFQKGFKDDPSVPWTRPDTEDTSESSPIPIGNVLIDTITSDSLIDSETGDELIES